LTCALTSTETWPQPHPDRLPRSPKSHAGNADAARVLALRKNSNQVLATIIWGNVSTNVLLTLLSDSVLAGLYAFFFSAIVITLLGEIFPQAYYSRNALRMTSRFLLFLRFYLFVLYPLTKPTAMVLDAWLGKEGIAWLAERDVRTLIGRNAAVMAIPRAASRLAAPERRTNSSRSQEGIVVFAEANLRAVEFLLDEAVAVKIVGGLVGEGGHTHHYGAENFIADVEVIMREAAPLARKDAVVRVLGGIFRHADADGRPLLHAFENEVDAALCLESSKRKHHVPTLSR
jgi:hypothetical protein